MLDCNQGLKKKTLVRQLLLGRSKGKIEEDAVNFHSFEKLIFINKTSHDSEFFKSLTFCHAKDLLHLWPTCT